MQVESGFFNAQGFKPPTAPNAPPSNQNNRQVNDVIQNVAGKFSFLQVKFKKSKMEYLSRTHERFYIININFFFSGIGTRYWRIKFSCNYRQS